MSWEFTAKQPSEVGKIRQTWPKGATSTVAGELLPFLHLLESLAQTNIVRFPFIAAHIGELGVPDFHLKQDGRLISVEVAKVTTPKLEKARALQQGLHEVDFSAISVEEVRNPRLFLSRLRSASDGVSHFIRSQLTPSSISQLETLAPSPIPPKRLQRAILENIRTILNGESIWDEERFVGVDLRAETRKIVRLNPRGAQRVRLNRLLLEDAYPAELWRHFCPADICMPEEFASKLKHGRCKWACFVVSRLNPDCWRWLEGWCGQDPVPKPIVEMFAESLNSIVDGPEISGSEALSGAMPPAALVEFDGFRSEETFRDRKCWLEEAFWDCMRLPINPTLMVNPFIQPLWKDWEFCVEDLNMNGTLVASRLRVRSDGVSKHIWAGLDATTREELEALQQESSPSDRLRQEVVGRLNGLVSGDLIWAEDLFHGVDLRTKTRTMLAVNPIGGKLHELNRLLLEDAYPLELSRCRSRKREIVETGFLVPAQDFGSDISQEREIWLERVLEEISDKSRTHAGGDFQHGNEDWLLLVDRLGTPDWDLSYRTRALSHRLAKEWRGKWFTRIFIQDEDFEWQIMLTPDGASRLPAA
jgi:hypothetical protein